MSPNEFWQSEQAKGFEVVEVSEEEAAELFRPHVIRTVRRCLIEWNSNTYFNAALEQYHGDKVIVGIDVKDGSYLTVRRIDKVDGKDEPGALICTARFAGNETRYVPYSLEQAAIETRAKGRMKRLSGKMADVEGELKASLYLEADATPVMDLPMEPVAIMEPVEPEGDLLEHNVVQLANFSTGGEDHSAHKPKSGKRVFASDEELAVFALQHPEELTDNQKELLWECLRSHVNVDLFRMSGIDVAALKDALRRVA